MEMIIGDVLTLVKKKMIEQGAFDRAAYKGLVQESIDYFVERGKLTDEDNLEFIEDRLMDAYEEVRDSYDGESFASDEDAADDDENKDDDDKDVDEDKDGDGIKVLGEDDIEELDELDEAYRKEEEEE